MLSRLFILLGGALVVVLTVALIAPFFVDWTNYRADFERETSRIVGRDVTVGSATNARLLPFPSVTFENVEIKGNEGAGDIRLASLRMDAELTPFMRGEVLIFDTRIDGLDATLNFDQSGALIWPKASAEAFDLPAIALENITLTNGQIAVQRPDAEQIILSQMAGDFSAAALTGPWRGEGRATLNDQIMDWRFIANALDDAGRGRLKTSLKPAFGIWSAELDGGLIVEAGIPRYDGNLILDVHSAAPNIEQSNSQNIMRLARISGDIQADFGGLVVDNLRLESGSEGQTYTAEGRGEISFGDDPNFLIVLDGQQFRVDDIAENGPEDRVAVPQSLGSRLFVLENFLRSIPRPTISGEVRLNLPAIIAGDTTFRNVALRAQPENRDWRLLQISAQLPGRTTLEGNGLVSTANGLTFNGDLTLGSLQPTGFATWLSGNADDIVRTVSAAGFSARAELSERRQVLRDLELQIGDASLRGFLDRRAGPDIAPALAMQLEGEALDLDALRALMSVFIGDAQSANQNSLDIALKAGPVSFQNYQAGALDLAFRLDNAVLDVDRLTISDLYGASFTAVGQLNDPFSKPEGSIDLTLFGDDLAPFADQLSAEQTTPEVIKSISKKIVDRANYAPKLLRDARLDAILRLVPEGDKNTVIISATGESASGSGAINANLHDINTLAGQLSAELRSEDGNDLLAALGLPVLALETLPAMVANFTSAGDVSSFDSAVEINAANGDRISFSASNSADGTSRQSYGQYDLQVANLEPYLFTMGQNLPGAGFGLEIKSSGPWRIAMDEKKASGLTLPELSATISGQAVSGNLDLAFATDAQETIAAIGQEKRPILSGNIALENLDMTILGEAFFGYGPFYDVVPWYESEATFADMTDLPVDLDMQVKAKNIDGFGPPLDDVAFGLQLDTQSMRLDNFKASQGDGSVTMTADLTKSGASTLMIMQGNVVNIALQPAWNVVFNDADIVSPNGNLDLQIDVSGSGATFPAVIASFTGSGTIGLENLVLEGLNSTALPTILNALEEPEIELNEARTKAIAEPLLRDGQIKLTSLLMPYTMTSGVLRSAPVFTDIAGGQLSFTPKLDLRDLTFDLNGTMSMHMPRSDFEIVGAIPELRFALNGPLSKPDLSLDTQPLHGFIAARALAREQARVEALQAQLLERQRLRRDINYFKAEQRANDAAAALQAEQDARDAALQLQAEQDQLEQTRLQNLRLEQAAQQKLDEAKAADEAARAAITQQLITEQEQVERQALPQINAAPNEALDTPDTSDTLLKIDDLLRQLESGTLAPSQP